MRRPTFDFLQSATGRFAILLGAALILLLKPLSAFAGQQVPCSKPVVFQGAIVNSLVLPYRYVGPMPTAELDRASREIAGLVHFEILYSLLKYGSVGGTDLVAKRGEVCDVDRVIEEVIHPDGAGTLLPGRMLIVTWGRLFEQGDQLYLQSYLRFLQGGKQGPVFETNTIRLQVDETPLPLVAALPTQALAFPPRQISKADLAKVKEEFDRAMVVRSEPSLNVTGDSIDFKPDTTFPYYITKVQGDWMWIEPMLGGPKGWVRARTDSNGKSAPWSLQRWLPELAYIDAIAGFMRLRVREGMTPDLAGSLRKSITNGFSIFEQAVPQREAPVAYGLARAVQGFVALDLDKDAKGQAKAAQLFAEARALMPDYASARNLAAITQSLDEEKGILDTKSAARLNRELVGALALDPGNLIVLNNLEKTYNLYASQPKLSPFSAQDLSHRITVLNAVRKKEAGKQ
jgi:hypothetical protein